MTIWSSKSLARASLAIAVRLAGALCLTANLQAQDLSFEDRVHAQRAIERAYFAHMEGAREAFEDVVTEELLRGKVRSYLEETVALKELWGTEVTATMLEAELRRIERSTRFPGRLQEIYAALGNDPVVVQECFVRPILTRRLTRNFFAYDGVIHEARHLLAESARARLLNGEEPFPLPEEVSVSRGLRLDASQPSNGGIGGARKRLGLSNTSVSDVLEEREAFVVRTLVTDQDDPPAIDSYRIAKRTWDDWWPVASGLLDESTVAVVAENVPLQHAAETGGAGSLTCGPDDVWDNGSLDDFPEAPRDHTAIWTGTHMIVWGGFSEFNYSEGLKYDPLTDTWEHISLAGAPDPRIRHSAVWTGSEMIIWGVQVSQASVNTGGRYDPAADSWSATSLIDAPSPAQGHTAVWTGNEMIIWSGGTGGRYVPTTDVWLPLSTTSAPTPRSGHSAVWTGSRMIIWGGGSNTGALYDPSSDSWTPMAPLLPIQWTRSGNSAVWTGTEMIVWGGIGRTGVGSDWLNTGARFNPATDTWSATSLTGAATKRAYHSAVWTGQLMLVWGGEVNVGPGTLDDGARYDPATDSWSPITLSGRPERRSLHSTVWTGDLMVVFGGAGTLNEGIRLTGGRYDPDIDKWTPVAATNNAPEGRADPGTVWTGTHMIVWGGTNVLSGLPVGSGGSYDPLVDDWESLPWLDAPAARTYHSTAWTGSRMLIWGGTTLAGGFDSPAGALDTGSAYDPIARTWTPISAAGAPVPRERHASAWTGSHLLVWGGRRGTTPLTSGGRYDPASDSWAPVSEIGAPSGRWWQTSVWTGQEMIVWGGQDAAGIPTDTGARYDPAADSWSAVSGISAPSPRSLHSAVWDGQQMLIWGGWDGNADVGTGAGYRPATDTWSPVSGVGAPIPRNSHGAIWTGREMVVWGGRSDGSGQSNGGRYSPISDSWRPVSTNAAPSGRRSLGAVWTGSEMIVWGGLFPWGGDATGGRYLIDTSPDADADSFARCGGDCDDADASTYPAAPQLCDGVNNDCADPGWPAVPQGEADGDQDGVLACAPDCDDGNASVWALPGEVRDLGVEADTTTLAWLAPQEPGGLSVVYDLLRTPVSGDFMTSASCAVTDQGATMASDPTLPPPGGALFYLARAGNGCPGGEGSLGADSAGAARTGRNCDPAPQPVLPHPLRTE